MIPVTNVDEIVAAALKLDPGTRREVVEKLARSLEEEISETEWESAWEEELDRRIEAREAGRSRTVPLETIVAKARARLGSA